MTNEVDSSELPCRSCTFGQVLGVRSEIALAMSNAEAPLHLLRVLVADDHPVVRSGWVQLLSAYSDLHVVAEAADGDEAVAAWRTVRPDIGLIDLSMPRLDGFGALRAIRECQPDARLVVMTALAGDEDVYRALQLGASGFLMKECGGPELVACLRTVAAGGKHLHSAAASRLIDRLTLSGLTPREQQVLQWLASGLQNKVIADRLQLAEGTIKTHLKSIYAKLGVSSRTQAARVATERGLVPSLR